jgi:hypothetical protein
MIVHKLGEKPIEFEIAHEGSTAASLLVLVHQHGLFREIEGIAYAHPSVLYTLKMSHRYLKNSRYFSKTMADIHALRAAGFGEIPECLHDWYRERMRVTYLYAHPKLNQSKEGFFKDDNINYVYDHDTLHECVKTFDRPAFEFIKKDAAEVYCSREKFLEAPETIKLATVLEESYVLALERHQIPNDFRPNPEVSFRIALEKVCTSIASGWWREYAWEHYHAVRALYRPDYVERFHQGLASGTVKPYQAQASSL